MKRNSMGDPQTFVEFLHAEYPEAFENKHVTAYLDHELGYAHRNLIERLTSIKEQSTALLDELKGDESAAWNAVAKIEHGAGASGPINTQYQAAVRDASRIMAIVSGFRNGLAAAISSR